MLQGEFLHPKEHEKLIFTDASNAGWGAQLDHNSTGGVCSPTKTPTHQPIGNEGSSPGPAVLQNDLQEQLCSYCLRQHLRGVVHKQTGWYKIHRTLRCNVENSDLVQPQQYHTQSKTHTRVTQCDSGWPLQEESDPAHRMVPISIDLQTSFQDMGESPSRPVCDQPEYKTSSVRLSYPAFSGLGSRHPEHPMGKPGCLCFSSYLPLYKTSTANVQVDIDHLRLADKAMVWGPSGNVIGCTTTTSSDLNLTQTTTEQSLPRQPSFPQPPCLVSRSTALKQHGFTAEVAERIAAPQRHSTRTIYSSKWSIFQRWCLEQQVDFRNPSTGDICNFSGIFFMTSTGALLPLKGTEQLLQIPSGIQICTSAPIPI